MTMRSTTALVSTLPLLLAILGCVPGKGQITVIGDGALVPDSAPRAERQLTADRGPPPPPRESGAPLPEGKPATPDQQPPASCPPPFGNTQGLTASDVTGVPDCADKPYSIHGFCNQKRGVLIAMMSPD
jgi:hypothetical protein